MYRRRLEGELEHILYFTGKEKSFFPKVHFVVIQYGKAETRR